MTQCHLSGVNVHLRLYLPNDLLKTKLFFYDVLLYKTLKLKKAILCTGHI